MLFIAPCRSGTSRITQVRSFTRECRPAIEAGIFDVPKIKIAVFGNSALTGEPSHRRMCATFVGTRPQPFGGGCGHFHARSVGSTACQNAMSDLGLEPSASGL